MNKTPKVMVCVTVQRSSEKLIRAGHDIASALEGLLYVVHVVKQGGAFLGNENQGEALEHLYQLSRELDAQMNVIRAEYVVETLVKTARQYGATIIVLGAPARHAPGEDFAGVLQARLPKVEVRTVFDKD